MRQHYHVTRFVSCEIYLCCAQTLTASWHTHFVSICERGNCIYSLYDATILQNYRPIDQSFEGAYIAENNDLRFDEKVPTSSRRPRAGKSPATKSSHRENHPENRTPVSTRQYSAKASPFKKNMESPSLAFGTRYTPEPKRRQAALTPGGPSTPPRPTKSAWSKTPSPLRQMQLKTNIRNQQEKYSEKFQLLRNQHKRAGPVHRFHVSSTQGLW